MSLESVFTHNMVFAGLAAKVAADIIHDLFVEADKDGLVQKNQGWLKPTEVVLALVVTLLQVALTSGLSGISVDQIKEAVLPLIQTLLGIKAAGSVTAKALAQKTREAVKTQLAK